MANVNYTEGKTKIIGGVEITLPEGVDVTFRTQMNDDSRVYLYAGDHHSTHGLLAVVKFPTREEYLDFLEAFDDLDGKEW